MTRRAALRVLHVSSEVAPWARTGGLGDVVGALPSAQSKASRSVTAEAVLPLYRGVKRALAERGITPEDTGVHTDVHLGPFAAHVRFLRVKLKGYAPTLLARCDTAFDRDGLYGYDDDGLRFAVFCRAVMQAAPELMEGGPPDILHAHDWHAALIPALLATSFRRHLPDTRSVLTIHNLAYQGVFPRDLLPATGLPWDVMHPELAEFHGHLNLLKTGIGLADVITTVSPTYAHEIRTPALGANLDGFLRRFDVRGILNGIDPAEWSPAKDSHTAARYDADDLTGKAACRKAIHDECEWADDPDQLLLGVVSRMTSQKGLDLVAEIVPQLYAMGARLAVLGSGDRDLEDRFKLLARHHQHHIRVKIGFDTALSHRIIAGCDALLVPSRFEPCGLTQLYAMAYGTVPIVHETGGLADTVHDPGDRGLTEGHGTGFVFAHPTVEGLRWATARAARLFREDRDGWRQIQRAGMTRDWSWKASANAYLDLYREILAR